MFRINTITKLVTKVHAPDLMTHKWKQRSIRAQKQNNTCNNRRGSDRCVGVEHVEYLEAVDLTSYVGTIPTWLVSYFLV